MTGNKESLIGGTLGLEFICNVLGREIEYKWEREGGKFYPNSRSFVRRQTSVDAEAFDAQSDPGHASYPIVTALLF